MESGEFLEHYGVKGMKWGVRRSASELRAARASRKAKRSEAKAAQKASQKKALKERWEKPVDSDAIIGTRSRTKRHGTDALSNEELNRLVTRMELERRYAMVSADPKGKAARESGESYIKDVLKNAGREAAAEAFKWAATEATKSAFKAATNSSRTTGTATVIRNNVLGSGQRSIEGRRMKELSR